MNSQATTNTSTSFKGLYAIRLGTSDDKNFVMATFLRGLYYGDSWFSLIPKDVFMSNYSRVAEHLVNTGSLYVACLKDAPDVIIGYSLWSADHTTLHWVYVKNTKLEDGTTWRNKGVARSLVAVAPQVVSHLTTLGKKLLTKFPNNVIFNPFKV